MEALAPLVLIGLLLLFFGIAALVAFLLHVTTKPVLRAARDHQIEKQLRDQVGDVEAQQRAAQKLLRERSL